MEAKGERKTSKESRRRYDRKKVDISCDYLPLHADKELRNPMKGRIRKQMGVFQRPANS
jgi:hypothetical protein